MPWEEARCLWTLPVVEVCRNRKGITRPVLKVHLNTDRYQESQLAEFLAQASHAFSGVLGAPVDRIRVYLIDVPKQLSAIGGVVNAPDDAPFFEFFLLAGRPPEHRTELLTRFTDLLEACLGVNRKAIRGLCWHVDPNDWAIAGVPASARRAEEIEQRQQALSHD